MFDCTVVSWSRVRVGASIVDGEARNTIEIVLVATCDDSLDAKWRRDGDDRKRVLVELFEDDVHALVDLVSFDEAKRAIRERLALALVVLP